MMHGLTNLKFACLSTVLPHIISGTYIKRH